MTHHYKAALARLERTHQDKLDTLKRLGLKPARETIANYEATKNALMLADKLMQEPSEAMVEVSAEAALNATRQYVELPKTKLNKLRVDSKASYIREARAALKAMRDQLLKEVE